MLTLLFALTALAGPPQTDATTSVAPDASDRTSQPRSASALMKTMGKGKCERPATAKRTGRPTPGADQFYLGKFTIDTTGTVSGIETRQLFANEAWRSQSAEWANGSDCVVVWNITGTKQPASACKTCDFGIHFEGNVDHTATTCNKRIASVGAHFRNAYDIKITEEGGIEVFFSNSGNPLATGYIVDSSFEWVTAHQCQWF